MLQLQQAKTIRDLAAHLDTSRRYLPNLEKHRAYRQYNVTRGNMRRHLAASKLVCLRGILHPTFLAHLCGQFPAKAQSARLHAFTRYPQFSMLDHELIYDLEWCVAVNLRADCSHGCDEYRGALHS